MITVAFGDIHGLAEPLKELVDKVLRWCIDKGIDQDDIVFVFVGDYIDRGPDSKGVIDFLMDLEKRVNCVFLRGNHEDMFLNDWENFLYNGGLATLASYGIDAKHSFCAQDLALSLIPEAHVNFIKSTKLWHRDSMRTYVHAGINRSNGDVSQQYENSLLWIREPFLSDPRPDGGFVVHGHTPTPYENSSYNPVVKDNRCNVDTGGVFGGALTAAIFDDKQVKPIAFVQVITPRKGPH